MAVDLDALAEDLRAAGYDVNDCYVANHRNPALSATRYDGDFIEAEAEIAIDRANRFIRISVNDEFMPIIARHLTAQPAVPVDAIARLVAIEQATQKAKADPENPALWLAANKRRDAIQAGDCETVRAWLETIKGVGE